MPNSSAAENEPLEWSRVEWSRTVAQMEGTNGFAKEIPSGVDVNAVGTPFEGENAYIERDFTVVSSLPLGTRVQLGIAVELACGPVDGSYASLKVTDFGNTAYLWTVGPGGSRNETNTLCLEVGRKYTLIAEADMIGAADFPSADATGTLLTPSVRNIDLVSHPLAWDHNGNLVILVTAEGGLNCNENALAELYWAAGARYESEIIGTPILSRVLTVGSSPPNANRLEEIVPCTDLSTPPGKATHLVLVTKMVGSTLETNESNNITATKLRLVVEKPTVGVTLKSGFGTAGINLREIFRDVTTPDENLIYSLVYNSDVNLVEARTDNGIDYLMLESLTNKSGTATLTVRAMNPCGLTRSDSFFVAIQAAEPSEENPPQQFSMEALLTERSLNLQVSAQAGGSVAFETSIDLVNWVAFHTNSTATGSLNLFVPFETNVVGKFYRARTLLNQSTNSPMPLDMALIPGGPFSMGDPFNEGDGTGNEKPVHTVQTAPFYIQKHEVTKGLWDDVRRWAVTNGYYFLPSGAGQATNFPVHSVSWNNAVLWCNARSEMEGLVPAYYTDADHATVCRDTVGALKAEWVKWDAGYRLPTEAEWEKAARGGLNGNRYPWGNTISHSQANYMSDSFPSDVSPTSGYHPGYKTGSQPYTSPVGSFAPNGFGLFDVTGNLWEWCWDRLDDSYYASSPTVDPRGPDVGAYRVARGGSWAENAWDARVAVRGFATLQPNYANNRFGFRCVLPAKP